MRPVIDAFGSRPSVPGIAYITPTLGREDLHAHFYGQFAQQTHPNKRLYVLDEGPKPSSFFGALQDTRVTYVHSPSPRGEVTRIGAARNRLYAMAKEPFVLWLDDDDTFQPDYGSRMLGYIGSGDVAKLVVWNSLLPNGDIYQWDTRTVSQQHYAIVGAEKPQLVAVPETDPTWADAMLNGFGFGMLTRRSAWERVKFRNEGTEDYPWVRDLRSIGGKIVHVADYPEGILHAIHPRSQSAVFPQKYLGHRRQLGLGSVPAGSTQLPGGQPVRLQPGSRYAVLASVKKKHTLAALTARCATWDVAIEQARDNVSAAEFAEKPPSDADYRLVYVVATVRGSAPAEMPWTVPWPARVFDRSGLVRAWKLGSGNMIAAQPRMVGSRPPFAAPMIGAATPGDVLAYRAAWNQYVIDTVSVALACGAAYTSLATKLQASDPQTAATLSGIGQSMTDAANALLKDWNVWANTSSATILLSGSDILQQQQAAVLEASNVRESVVGGALTCEPTYANASGQTITWIAGPDPSTQAQIIARIEGFGILGAGILQILGTTAGVGLQKLGSAGEEIARQAAMTSSWILSPWTWLIAASLLVGTVVVVVYNADKVSKLVSFPMGLKEHAAEAIGSARIIRSRRRR